MGISGNQAEFARERREGLLGWARAGRSAPRRTCSGHAGAHWVSPLSSKDRLQIDLPVRPKTDGSTDRVAPVSGRAAVVGAGIAGLAAAHALEGLGYRVRVLEREASLRAEGAGLTLWPNAVRALRSLGLGDVLDRCGYALKTRLR